MTKLKPALTPKDFETVIHTFITFWVYYWNSRLPNSTLSRSGLQIIQNMAVCQEHKGSSHIKKKPILMIPRPFGKIFYRMEI